MTGFNSKREAAADKLQEPVAWIWKDMRGQDIVSLFEPRLNSIPLYAAPPQRTWVGLTDIDIAMAFDGVPQAFNDKLKFGRAIEQALKEKNT